MSRAAFDSWLIKIRRRPSTPVEPSYLCQKSPPSRGPASPAAQHPHPRVKTPQPRACTHAFYSRQKVRLAVNQTGKRKVVVVMRERGGRTLPFVVRAEDEGVATVARRVAKGSTVYADEASHWDALHARFDAKRINHGFAFSDDGACTNQAESFFARLRRAELGQHHHISGPYLKFYAGEMAWLEDTRRDDNGALAELAGVAALGHRKSRNWCGYWQRHAA